jgi:hypothetical protein
MTRFTVTRSPATAVMAIGLFIVFALAALLPFTQLRPMTVVYVAMLMTGVGMFLRERVLVRVSA